MRVAILGGGFQGCCIALGLSMRGIGSTIFDRGEKLMSRTAVANEGKVHLGYMYAADPSMRTARTMIEGALSFGPFLSRALERPQSSFVTSQPTIYVVHRDSQSGPDACLHYLSRTHALIVERARGAPDCYFGQDLRRPLMPLSPDAIAEEFDPETVLAAVATPEVAIDPLEVMAAIRARIGADPLIEVRLGHEVDGVSRDGSRLKVVGRSAGSAFSESFDQVANALWEGRLAVDARMGFSPGRPWLHRLKYGISLRSPPEAASPKSCTIISGPFGEVVNYPDGTLYLTWYPDCVRELSSEITPPRWDTRPSPGLERQIVSGTLKSMARFIRNLRNVREEDAAAARVKGGPIFAWGSTDIHDPDSELHRRYEIGVHSEDGYHSIDPGKLTMAPLFATHCADRMAG